MPTSAARWSVRSSAAANARRSQSSSSSGSSWTSAIECAIPTRCIGSPATPTRSQARPSNALARARSPLRPRPMASPTVVITRSGSVIETPLAISAGRVDDGGFVVGNNCPFCTGDRKPVRRGHWHFQHRPGLASAFGVAVLGTLLTHVSTQVVFGAMAAPRLALAGVHSCPPRRPDHAAPGWAGAGAGNGEQRGPVGGCHAAARRDGRAGRRRRLEPGRRRRGHRQSGGPDRDPRHPDRPRPPGRPRRRHDRGR